MVKINSDAPRVAEVNWDANFESYSQSFIGSKFYRDGKLVIFGNKCDYSIRNLLLIGASAWYDWGSGSGYEYARSTSYKLGFDIEIHGDVSLSVYAYMSNQINIIIHGTLYGGFKTFTCVPQGNGYHSGGATSGSINFIFDKNSDSVRLFADLELGSHYHWYGFNAIGNHNTMKAHGYNYYFRLVKFTTETTTDDQGVETTSTVLTNVDGTIPVAIDSDFRHINYYGDKTVTIIPVNGARIIFPYSSTNGFTLGQTADSTTANGRIIQQS